MISSMHVDPRSPARAAVPGGAHERSPTAKSPDNNHKKARPLGLSKSTNSPQSATPAEDARSPKLLLYFAPAPHLLDLLALALNVLERFSTICLGDAEKYCFQPPKPSARRWARHPHPQRIAQPETPH